VIRGLSVLKVALAGFVSLYSLFALGQAYPNKPVRLIVPFPPGGGNDIVGRVIGGKLGELMGRQVVIDNRGGGGTIIGTELVAKAVPDGYTLLLAGSASMAINPSLSKSVPYHPIKDFSPISLLGTASHILVVHPSLPVKSIKELIEYTRARPGKLNLASTGMGGPVHLAGELFKSMAGLDMVQIHYKGGGPAYVGLLTQEASVCFCGLASARPYLKDGRLRPLAVTTAKRTPTLPDIPTVGESGLPGYVVFGWYSLVAPRGTPGPVIARLNAEVRKAVEAPDVRKHFDALGIDSTASSPEEAIAFTRSEMEKWAKVIRAAGIKAE